MNVFIAPLRAFSNLSFRTRLIIANSALASLVIIGISYYTLVRASANDALLGDSLTESTRDQVESELNGSTSFYANSLDDFFITIANNIETVRSTLEVVLSAQSATEAGYPGPLIRLPTGVWDNPNNEVVSIFIPPFESIPTSVLAEVGIARQIDVIAPQILSRNEDALAVYFGSVLGETLYYPNIDLAALLPSDFDVTQRPWFLSAGPQQNGTGEVVWAEPYQDAAQNGLVLTCSSPVYDARRRFRGVVAIDIRLAKIDDLVSTIQVGQTGYAFLIDGAGHVISMPAQGYADFGIADPEALATDPLGTSVLKTASVEVFQVLAKMTTGQSGLQTVVINGTEKFIAFRPILTVGYSLGIVVPSSEMLGKVIATQERIATDQRETVTNVIVAIVVVLALFLFSSYRLGNALTTPLEQLTDIAKRIADGNLNVSAPITSSDEIGVMANSFNLMTENLRGLIGALESRVAERTVELVSANNHSERRARQLKTVSEVTRAISSEVDVEKLPALIASTISAHFGYYHVAIYTMDNSLGFAIIQAANSPGGKRLLARQHRAKQTDDGVISAVINSGTAQIASAESLIADPDLAETRSEIALPLTLRGKIFGILDIQSTDKNAFIQDDLEILGILADQIAIAVENARLVEESRQAVSEIQSLYGEYIGRVWDRKTAAAPLGYHLTPAGGKALAQAADWAEIQLDATNENAGAGAGLNDGENWGTTVSMPIHLRGQVIGMLNVKSANPQREWKADEVAIVEATADRLALALENARLFEETSGRAAREHTVAEIAAKIRETNDPQAMIRTAIEELQRALGVNRVEIVPQVASAFIPGRELGNNK